MFNLTVVFGPNGAAMQFAYKERKDAEAAFVALGATSADFAEIVDDYGQRGSFRISGIHGKIIDDVAQTGDAQIERQIQAAKTNVKLSNRAANEPAIKFSATTAGFPINHPGAPNGGRRPF